MKISTAVLLVLLQTFAAFGVFLDARRRPGRKVGFDVAVALVVPVVGVFLYLSTTRTERRTERRADAARSLASSTPPPVPVHQERSGHRAVPLGDPHEQPYTPDPSLVAELTAEVRRLRAELGATRAERDTALAELKLRGGPKPTG